MSNLHKHVVRGVFSTVVVIALSIVLSTSAMAAGAKTATVYDNYSQCRYFIAFEHTSNDLFVSSMHGYVTNSDNCAEASNFRYRTLTQVRCQTGSQIITSALRTSAPGGDVVGSMSGKYQKCEARFRLTTNSGVTAGSPNPNWGNQFIIKWNASTGFSNPINTGQSNSFTF